MRQRVTYHEVQQLAEFERKACISLYLPTHRGGPETRQDPIRLKNLIQQASERLKDAGQNEIEAKRLLRPATDRLQDNEFWAHQSDGLAMFLADDEVAEFRLPDSFIERAVVASTFHLTPLLHSASRNGRFHLLAVSQNSCRLFEGDRFTIAEREVEDLPADLQSALGWWRERMLSFHSHSTGRGDDTAMFHGHETGKQDIDVAAYFRRIVKALSPVIDDKRVPFVYAGVEEWFPLFRDAADALPLVKQPLPGNHDHQSAKDLHAAAWQIVEPIFQSHVDDAVERFGNLLARSHATADVEQVLPAARDGLIETLLYRTGATRHGEFDSATGEVGYDDSGYDLVNLAVVMALRTGAEVIPVDPKRLPEQNSVCAILRAPIEAIAAPA